MTTSPPFSMSIIEGEFGVSSPNRAWESRLKAHIFLFQPHIASIPRVNFFTKTTPDFLAWLNCGVNNNSPAEDMGLVRERGSVSGKTEVLTEYIQWLWFKWVQRNWWKVAQAPERPQAELCEKPCGLPSGFLQALTLFWFLWVSFPWVLLGGWKLQWSSKL